MLANVVRSRLVGGRRWLASATRRQLESYEREANAAPNNAHAQALLNRVLNESNHSNIVLSRVQSGQFAVNEEVYKEYVRALANLGKLESTTGESLTRPLANHLKTAAAGASSSVFQSSTSQQQLDAFYGNALASGTGAGPVIQVKLVEPSPRQQFLKSLKMTLLYIPFGILGAYMLFSGGPGGSVSDIGKPGGGGSGGGGGGGMDFSRLFLSQKDAKPVERPQKKFTDVMGADEAKEELQEIVSFLKDPAKFHRLGGKISRGVLLTGPPGTGKTLLAKAVAGEAGVPFFYASASEFEEMFVGVGAKRIRSLFEAARKHQPCIIFIDELDAVGGKREMRDSQYSKMTLNQLLVELDGFIETDGVVCIAATNLPQVLDKALIRPGRFDRQVVVPLPDIKGRKDILGLYAKKVPCADDVNLDIIARSTAGLSGAELANIINTAAVRASSSGAEKVTMKDIVQAKDRVLMGPERRSAVIPDDVKKNTAYHESGHCLVSLLTTGAKDLHQVTIIPRGYALGMNQFMESDTTTTQLTRKGLIAMIDTAMGGTAAEELIFGSENVSTGASNDLEQATNLAHAYVTTFGMGSLGKFSAKDVGAISSETQHQIDEEKRKLLNDSYKRVVDLLKTNMKDLHLLANALLERETLSGEEVRKLLNRK